MVRRGGTVDSSQRGYRELGTVEQVEPGSAVVDEGGLAVARQEFAVKVRSGAWRYKTPAVPFPAVLPLFQVSWLCHVARNAGGAWLVRCTPAMSVSSVA